jgi:hypothetical protein
MCHSELAPPMLRIASPGLTNGIEMSIPVKFSKGLSLLLIVK